MSSSNSTLPSISSSEIVHLQFILRLVVGILGLPMLLAGIIGNTINIFTFIKLGYYRENSCSLYILSRSIFDLTLLITGLGTRILSQSFQIDFTLTNHLWCKLRVPIIYINTLSSYTFLCLQSIDAFLVTSLSVSFRQKSNIQRGRYFLISFLLLWIIEELPYLYFQELIISSDGTSFMCITINSTYAKYRIYFVYLFLTTIVPLVLIIGFDFLTYRHLQMYTLQQQRHLLSILARQMTKMTLFHIAAVFLFQTPFAIAQCYFLTTGLSKEPIRNAQEQIIQQFFNILGYGIYATSFYCYFIASKRFRQQVFNAFFNHRQGQNRIQPT
ncbi:hypothetical protein I4U23_015593 [Adineta vaga]|nr:hypothetical protein I4U23_015593 [Adineta vaga]